MLNLRKNSGEKPFSMLRVTKDFEELRSLPSTCEVIQPDPADFFNFNVAISPDEGFYKGGRFMFSITIPLDYPCSAPKVKCTQTIYHPNINLSGNVCLNILREDWRPMYEVVNVILGLVFLFLQPNPDDPLNHDAAAMLKSDVDQFQKIVSNTMAGGTLSDVQYNNVLL